MIKRHWIAMMAAASLVAAPAMSMAQEVQASRSTDANLPYALFYPQPLVATGGGEQPLTINHPNAPLQCSLQAVPAEDTSWTAADALGKLDDAQVATAWEKTLPGFAITNKATTPYRDATALLYEGTSLGSEMGIPLTLVHTEAVTEGRGYVLECLYSTAEAEQARPIVNFIIANFSTRSDTECCSAEAPAPVAPAAPQ